MAKKAAPAQPEEIEEVEEGGGNQSTIIIAVVLVLVLAVAGYVLFSKSGPTGPPPAAKPTTPIPGAKTAAAGALTSPSFFSGLTNLANQIATDAKGSSASSGGAKAGSSSGGSVDATPDPNSPTGYVDSGGNIVNADGSDYTGDSTYVNTALAAFSSKLGY